jgi:hypothetical protein
MNKQVCCGEAAVFGKGFFHLTVVLARFRELSAKRNPNAFDALDDAGSDHGACSPLLFRRTATLGSTFGKCVYHAAHTVYELLGILVTAHVLAEKIRNVLPTSQ